MAGAGRGRMAAAAWLGASLWAGSAAGGCSHGARFQPYPEAEIAGHRNAHDFRGQPLCQACHVPGNGLKGQPLAVCGHCHDVGHMRHPMAVPMRPTPEGLPLWDGTIVCHTCHDPHQRKAPLRKPFDDLCKPCHMRH